MVDAVRPRETEDAARDVCGEEARVDGADDVEIEAEDEENLELGARKVVWYNDPQEPTVEEKEEHCKTHIPSAAGAGLCARWWKRLAA